MYEDIYHSISPVISSVYGSGAYNSSTYNGSSTTSTGSTTSPATVTTAVAVTFVDSNVPYVAGQVQDVSTEPVCIGTAPAGSKVTVTFNPGNVVCTTIADSSGKWTCTPTTPISLGLHTVSIVAVTPQGQTVTLASFQVDATHSAVQKSMSTQGTTTPKMTSHSSNAMDVTFIIIFILILLGLGIFFLLKRRKKKDDNNQAGPTVTPTPTAPPTTPAGTSPTTPTTPSTPAAPPESPIEPAAPVITPSSAPAVGNVIPATGSVFPAVEAPANSKLIQ